MRNHVYVRPFRPGDAEAFWQWSVENFAKNNFDPGILLYPTTSIMVMFDKSGVLGYMPVQKPLMLESFAPRPGLDELGQASAMKAMTQQVVTQAYAYGAGEIYFLTKDDETAEFAKRQAYEEMENYRVFRIKLRDLEGVPDEVSTNQNQVPRSDSEQGRIV